MTELETLAVVVAEATQRHATLHRQPPGLGRRARMSLSKDGWNSLLGAVITEVGVGRPEGASLEAFHEGLVPPHVLTLQVVTSAGMHLLLEVTPTAEPALQLAPAVLAALYLQTRILLPETAVDQWMLVARATP